MPSNKLIREVKPYSIKLTPQEMQKKTIHSRINSMVARI